MNARGDGAGVGSEREEVPGGVLGDLRLERVSTMGAGRKKEKTHWRREI